MLETGVSHDPCSEVYCGDEAFSEIESQNIRDFVLTLNNPVPTVGWCFHSYSQLWLWPYGYDYGAYPDNWKELEQLAIDASDALFQVILRLTFKNFRNNCLPFRYMEQFLIQSIQLTYVSFVFIQIANKQGQSLAQLGV